LPQADASNNRESLASARALGETNIRHITAGEFGSSEVDHGCGEDAAARAARPRQQPAARAVRLQAGAEPVAADGGRVMAKRKAPDPSLGRSAEPLYREIRAVLESARAGAYRAVNAAMVQAYWQVGRLIVEHEQKGRRRAGYGEAVIATLAERLTRDLGRGFDERNLWYMRSFHLAFPILNAPRSELPDPGKRNAARSELAIRHSARDESPAPAQRLRPAVRELRGPEGYTQPRCHGPKDSVLRDDQGDRKTAG